MRSREFVNKPTLISEVSMSPSDLKKFASTDDANGILAGFEAELIMANRGATPDDDEEDMSYDTRPDDIDEVIDFFSNNDYGRGMSVSRARRLRQQLDELYDNWLEEQMLDDWQHDSEDMISTAWLAERSMDERIYDALTDGLGLTEEEADEVISSQNQPSLEMASKYEEAKSIAQDILEEEIQNSMDQEDSIYRSALADYRDDYTPDSDDRFFSDNDLRYMSDIADNYSLGWPYWTDNGGSGDDDNWDEVDAHELATELKNALQVKTKVGNGYHSVARDNVSWIIERDTSLKPDSPNDMAVEIISPPMPLLVCLQKMEEFFAWAQSNDAYANQTTGFHMGVSLPYRGGDVDYLKLALFLGDEYVLTEFERDANYNCRSALEKIREKIGQNFDKTVSDTMQLMKGNLLELAQRSLRIPNSGFGKRTSINPKTDDTNGRLKYIEFRSAGNIEYFDDINKLKNTLLRYAQAMQIAGDPSAYRKEYAKKLYKLISRTTHTTQDPTLALFSQYATGVITAGELKTQWADLELVKDPQLTSKRGQLANRIQTTQQQKDQQDTNQALADMEAARIPRDWEFYHSPTGQVLDRVTDISQTLARSVLADVQRRYGASGADTVRMRSVPTAASAARARTRVQDVDLDVAQNFTNPTNENFANGRGPGRPGDSQRHGIPKGATMAQLEKASHSAGRKGQLARWQLNMRRGHKK